LTSNDCSSQHETLQRPQANTIYETSEIKIPKAVALPPSYTIPESISKKRIPSEALCFLHEQPKSKRYR
jgi:hypothetical protein